MWYSMQIRMRCEMATIYDYRNFNQLKFDVSDNDVHAMAQCIARDNNHSVVVERDNDDIYRITPKGKQCRMPEWFMIGTLGGKP